MKAVAFWGVLTVALVCSPNVMAGHHHRFGGYGGVTGYGTSCNSGYSGGFSGYSGYTPSYGYSAAPMPGSGYTGGGFGGGYYGSGYGGHTHSRWHDTSHYDYHPGQYVPHRGHLDYVPGHYDFHRTGHFDTIYHR